VCYGIDISLDISSKHSNTWCKCCYTRIASLRGGSTISIQRAKNDIESATSIWTEFDPHVSASACSVCSHFDQQTSAGRPRKKVCNFQRKQTTNNDSQSSESLLSSQTDSSSSLPFEQETPSKDDDESSPMPGPSCTSTPIIRKRKLFDSTLHASPEVNTTCEGENNDSHFKVPGPSTWTPPRKRYRLSSPSGKSPKSFANVATSPLKSAEEASVRPACAIQLPFLKSEEELLAKMTQLKLNSSTDKHTVTLKTGGQPIVLKKTVKARKASRVVSSPVRKRRNIIMEKVRLDLSGGTTADEAMQQGYEIRKAKKQKKQVLLEEAGYKKTAFISSKDALALRTSVGLSYSQTRKLHRFVKKRGVKIESERKQREVQQDIQAAEFDVKTETLTDAQGKTTKTSVVHIKNLPDFIYKTLDKYDDNKELTWHDNGIPEDEIWIKLGGDHGGGTFKLMLQVGNVKHPNSKFNTFLIAIVNTKDSADNLKKIIRDPFKKQIDELQQAEWKGKKIRVFLFGDYDFLLKMFGISGAQSTHPCLWCKATSQQLQHPRQVQTNCPRTVANIKRDYGKYQRHGKQKKKAKMCNNVTSRPILNIPLVQVTPPYLHILLGVTKKHHVLLEESCHSLDLNIAQELAKETSTGTDNSMSPQFRDYVAELQKKEQLEWDQILLQGNAFFTQAESDFPEEEIDELLDSVWDLQDRIDEIDENNRLPYLSGPVGAYLETILNRNKIEVQAYHSRSFIGNHCHQYMKPAVYEDICGSVLGKTMEVTDNHNLHREAEDIQVKFLQLNALYSTVHRLISHAKPLPSADEDQEGEIQAAIDRYMAFFRQAFPTTRVLPKQHILECHCVDFMRQWRFGLGLLGEQGGEECHAVVNAIKRRCLGMKQEVAQLMFIIKEQTTMSSPELRATFLNEQQRSKNK